MCWQQGCAAALAERRLKAHCWPSSVRLPSLMAPCSPLHPWQMLVQAQQLLEDLSYPRPDLLLLPAQYSAVRIISLAVRRDCCTYHSDHDHEYASVESPADRLPNNAGAAVLHQGVKFVWNRFGWPGAWLTWGSLRETPRSAAAPEQGGLPQRP